MTVSKLKNKLEPVSRIDPAEILVVIPALNEEAHIENCIRSLIGDSSWMQSVAVIVADGGSRDQTRSIVERLRAEFPSLDCIDNPKKLQSAALNLAVQDCAGSQTQYLVRCDAHSDYPDNFVEEVVKSLLANDATSVVVPMDSRGEGCFGRANAWIVDTPLGNGGSAHRAGTTSHFVDHGHHAGFRLDAFQAAGGYDETFSHNEDAEFDHRLARNGGRIFLDTDIRVAYTPRKTARSLAKQYFNYGKGRARTVHKHGLRLKFRQAIPILALLGIIGGLLMSLLHPVFLIVPLGYGGVLALASAYMILSKASLCGVYAGLASGIMHMSWAAGFCIQSLRQVRHG